MTGGKGSVLPLALATLLAGGAGVAVGSALALDRPAQRPTPQRVGLASGVARLPLPAGWEPLNRHSSLPGLEDATAVRGVHSAVALDIRRPEDPSLLPADLRAAAGGDLPAPRPRRLEGREAWRYDLLGAGAGAGAGTGSGLVAVALPTTGGVVTIACQADAASLAGARAECEEAMGGLQLDGASALVPSPETAARIALPKVVARLNGERRRGRRALVRAGSPQRRAHATQRLARAYREAAEGLQPLAAGEARRLTFALGELDRRHRELARASAKRDARAARRKGLAIERGERRLGALLAAFGD